VTRAELIAALARDEHWMGCDCDGCKLWVAPRVDAIVAFVAGWLEAVPLRYEPEPRPWELARKWREDMEA
jgi:hypothetical protein